ncbi:hypothetical protein, partial [Clostridioides difficile]|uniref:hypothetical protein n=1 Tax=Clostridioides difficile TaxID=1496 RepID=UPI00155A3869
NPLNSISKISPTFISLSLESLLDSTFISSGLIAILLIPSSINFKIPKEGIVQYKSEGCA